MVPVGPRRAARIQDMLQQLHLLRRLGHGEPRAARRRHLLRRPRDKLWVNLYAPSTASGRPPGVSSRWRRASRRATRATLTLDVRAPKASHPGAAPSVLGRRRVRREGERRSRWHRPAPGFVRRARARTWKTGDTVTSPCRRRCASSRCPTIRAARRSCGDRSSWPATSGPSRPTRAVAGRSAGRDAGVPVFAADRPIAEWLKPVAGKPGTFRTDGVGARPRSVLPVLPAAPPRLHGLLGPLHAREWDTRPEEIAAERERQRQLEAATVAYVQPGTMQPERGFNQQGEETSVARRGPRGRRAAKWFSFDVPVDPSQPMTLVVTYHSDNRRPRDLRRPGRRRARRRGAPLRSTANRASSIVNTRCPRQ